MAKLSRRKLAINAATRITNGESNKSVMRELAGYLIDTNRRSEATLIVRDIEAMLAMNGTVIGSVTSARPLSASSVTAIEEYIRTTDSSIKNVTLREFIDEDLIGGVKLEVPGAQLDASVKAKLDKITA